MSLKELRLSKKITQKQAAELCSVSLRSYKDYENNPKKEDSVKYKYLISVLERCLITDEDHGVLSVDEIKKKCAAVFSEYGVKYCYLFGSYAKGRAKENSDVDLLIASDVTGLRFFGLAESLREALNKRVDTLDLKQLENNPELMNEILQDGIKIYG